jgi:hypothetical protein
MRITIPDIFHQRNSFSLFSVSAENPSTPVKGGTAKRDTASKKED